MGERSDQKGDEGELARRKEKGETNGTDLVLEELLEHSNAILGKIILELRNEKRDKIRTGQEVGRRTGGKAAR